MPALLSDLSISRWGRSIYETEEDVALEKAFLSQSVQVVEEFSDAVIAVVHSKLQVDAALLDL